MGKRVKPPGQGSRRQSAVSGAGNGNSIRKYLQSAHYMPGAVMLLLDWQGSGWKTAPGFWWGRGQRSSSIQPLLEVDPTHLWTTKLVKGLLGPTGYGRC